MELKYIFVAIVAALTITTSVIMVMANAKK